MIHINEVHKASLVAKSASNQRLRNRTKVSVIKSAHSMDRIDMNKLFKKDIFECIIPIRGETDNYDVTISFGGVVKRVRELLKTQLAHTTRRGNYDPVASLTFNIWVQALKKAFDREDVYMACTCPDFKYRFRYWATRNKYNSTYSELRPANITNPNDSLGSGCKHTLNVLKNLSWLLRCASVIYNYVRVLNKQKPDLFNKVIQPVLFGDETVQVSRQKFGSERITPPSQDVVDIEDVQEDTVEDRPAEGETV